MRIMSFEESFGYPLILLLIGVGFSYYFGTKLTRKYQRRQKKIDIEREDLHRSISIKDNMIRQFSDVVVEFEQMLTTIQLMEIKKSSVKDLMSNYDKLQLRVVKLALLIRLYFGEENPIYNQFADFAKLLFLMKNYGIKNTKEKEEEIIKELDKLITKKLDVMSDAHMKEIGVESNFYTKVSPKIGRWGYEFSQRILDTKLK